MGIKLLITLILYLITTSTFGQDKIDSLLKKLNLIHMQSRVLISGKVEEIYINRTSTLLDIDGKMIPLNEYSIDFENNYSDSHKNNMNVVMIKCKTGNCIADKRNNNIISGLGLFFKSKKASYDFINILDQIRDLIISKQVQWNSKD